MSTYAQTQTISRVPAAVVNISDARIVAPASDTEAPTLDAEVAAPAADARVVVPEHSTEAREESVEHMYKTGLAKLEALHDRWAAAVAEIRQAPASGEPGKAAA